MKNIRSLLVIVLCVTAVAQNEPKPTAHAPIYITHVVVIDTETGREVPDQTVIISGEKIADIRDSGITPAPMNARIVDGKGRYLIPGLWDMHVHGTRFDSTLPLYIANGVTGVRDMWGPDDANKFRAELAAKHLIAPHLYLASPIVDGKPPIWPNSIAVETADEARKVVDEQKQRGADFIKVYSVLSRDAYFAIIDEARRQNIPVEGHVPNSVSIWEVTAAKQRSIEHLFGMEVGCSSREKDLRPKFLAAQRNRKEWEALRLEAWQSYSDERCQSLFAELKKNGTWPVPTLVVRRSFGLLNDPQFTSDNRVRYFSGEFRDWMTGKLDPRMKESSASDFAMMRETLIADERATGKLFRAGVPILAGTDVGNEFCFPGFSLHDELALLVESGLTPLAALQAATRNPATFMNATDRYGSVTKRKIADLVLLDADPLQDIHNTTKISEVFLDGKEFDRAALNGILKNAEQEANASLKLSPAEQEVWAQEETYWRSLKADDRDTYLRLWDERFVGWPRYEGAPAGKEKIRQDYAPGTTVRAKLVDYKLEPLSVRAYGNDIVIAFYRATMRRERNGQAETSTSRLTHTWMRTDQGWQIVGGMSADDNQPAVSAQSNRETPESSGYEAELRSLMASLQKGSLEGDVDAIANSMTDDCVQTDINGYRQDKTTWLNEYFRPLADLIKAGKFHWDEYERTNLQFRFYGNCAVVTGELHAKGTGAKFGAQHTWVADPNASFSGTLHFTHVYIKQNGKWMLAALHNQMPLRPANAAK